MAFFLRSRVSGRAYAEWWVIATLLRWGSGGSERRAVVVVAGCVAGGAGVVARAVAQ